MRAIAVELTGRPIDMDAGEAGKDIGSDMCGYMPISCSADHIGSGEKIAGADNTRVIALLVRRPWSAYSALWDDDSGVPCMEGDPYCSGVPNGSSNEIGPCRPPLCIGPDLGGV